MPFPTELALATKNPGKMKEILEICSEWPVTWRLARSPSRNGTVSADWPHVQETGETYLQNAFLKARAVAQSQEVPAIADDSGIEVDALRGAPGPRSARFAGESATDEDNLRLLISLVRDVPDAQRTAHYRCVAVCAWSDGRHVSAEGTCDGRLVLEARGTGGFGYDPIFVPEGERRTMAELTSAEKNAISHRGKAFRLLGEALAGSAPD